MTSCPRPTGEVQRALLDRIYRKLADHRVPVAGSIELTRRCNLRCVHCYVADGAPGDGPELDGSSWQEILDQAAAAGCLDLLITGGEPLSRPDFARIYAHARELGLVVTVFTNATLLTEGDVRIFRELPPHLVEVTIYGATAGTHDRVTGVPGSHARCLESVRRLLGERVRVGLKTMLMTLNRHEMDGMRRLARELGVTFRFDAALFPRLNGDPSPVSLRVPGEEALAEELADPGAVSSWRKYHDRLRDETIPGTLYHCGAGRTGFHVDAAGNLLPCLMAGAPGFPILSAGGFSAGWHGAIPAFVDREADAKTNLCQRCTCRALCAHCPAFSKLETGSEHVPSPYLCSMAHARLACVERERPGPA